MSVPSTPDTRRPRHCAKILGFRELRAIAQRLERHGSRETWGDLRVVGTRHDGTEIDSRWFSFGQKRALALVFWRHQSRASGIVVIDEVVNGLHHDWIDQILALIGDRQAILTSQNPLLLDRMEFESVEDVVRKLVLCSTEIVEGQEMMVWRDPTPAEATDIFQPCELGIQHVGEILRTHGLW